MVVAAERWQTRRDFDDNSDDDVDNNISEGQWQGQGGGGGGGGTSRAKAKASMEMREMKETEPATKVATKQQQQQQQQQYDEQQQQQDNMETTDEEKKGLLQGLWEVAKSNDMREVACVMVVCFTFSFAGAGVKVLLTSLFSVSFGISFVDSTYFAALNLLGLALCRAAAPYSVKLLGGESSPPSRGASDGSGGSGGNVIYWIYCTLLFFDTVMYGVLPTIMDSSSNVWAFWAVLLVVVGDFAGLVSLVQQLAMVHLGPALFSQSFVFMYAAVGAGGVLGPIVAFAFAESSDFSPDSFHSFFYAASALQGVSTLVMLYVALTRTTTRTAARRRQQQNRRRDGDESTDKDGAHGDQQGDEEEGMIKR